MNRPVLIVSFALFCAFALSGCGASGVDRIETASYQNRAAADPATREIAAGKRHFRAANYGLAERHFRKAVELRAGHAEGWLGLAASYDQLGRFDFADRAYEQLLKVAGRRGEIVNNMGYSQYLRGDHAKARQLYEEARRAMADTTLVDANLALLRRG